MSLNRSLMVGRLTRDPEIRYTNSGKPVTSFTLALNRNFNSSDGQQADYIPCVCWGKLAENVANYCNKGSLVGTDGRLQSRSYENASGQKVYVVEVVCDSVQFLETKRQNESQSNDYKYSQNKSMNRNTYENDPFLNDNSFNILEDDIQF